MRYKSWMPIVMLLAMLPLREAAAQLVTYEMQGQVQCMDCAFSNNGTNFQADTGLSPTAASDPFTAYLQFDSSLLSAPPGFYVVNQPDTWLNVNLGNYSPVFTSYVIDIGSNAPNSILVTVPPQQSGNDTGVQTSVGLGVDALDTDINHDGWTTGGNTASIVQVPEPSGAWLLAAGALVAALAMRGPLSRTIRARSI
jgi:hypothetical protein